MRIFFIAAALALSLAGCQVSQTDIDAAKASYQKAIAEGKIAPTLHA